MKKFNQIYFIVEGQTEFDFVRNILYREFSPCIIFHPIVISKTSGGLVHYSHLKEDIINQVHSKKSIVTTMIDLYALPGDFPKYEEAKNIKDVYGKVELLEDAIKHDIEQTVGKELYNFIPYIQLHEFESLIFSDVGKFEILFDKQIVEKLEQILSEFNNNPELINEGKDTAPSKRLLSLIPEFSKTLHGLLLAEEIGVFRMQRACRHFNNWVKRIKYLLSY